MGSFDIDLMAFGCVRFGFFGKCATRERDKWSLK